MMVPMIDPMRQQEVGAPLLTQLSNLDGQMQMILTDNSIPEELKLQKYMQTLQRYQILKGQQIPTAKPIVPEDLIDVDAVPKQSKNRVKMLLHHIKKHQDKIKWTPDGQLLVEDKIIDGSNITDLIHDATRHIPSRIKVPGAKEFASLLQETHVPQVAITKPSFNQSTDYTLVAETPSTSKFGVPIITSTPKSLRKQELKERSVQRKGKRNRKETEFYGDFVGHGWAPY